MEKLGIIILIGNKKEKKYKESKNLYDGQESSIPIIIRN
jgi:hypothetical protein